MTMLSPDLSSDELNTGYCRSAVTQALIMKASIVSLKPCFSVSTVCALRKASSSVSGLIELRDVRDRDPVAVQVGPRQLLDARQRLHLDRAELREIDFRPGGKVERQRAARLCRRRRLRRALQHAFHEGLHVGLQDAALRPAAAQPRQIDAELACELAHRRAGMRLRRRFLLRLARHWTRGRSRSDRRRAGAGAAAFGAAGF